MFAINLWWISCYVCSPTAITLLQADVHLANVTNLDLALFSVMNQESVSVRTTLLVTSVTCVSGGILDFLTPRVKVMIMLRVIK